MRQNYYISKNSIHGIILVTLYLLPPHSLPSYIINDGVGSGKRCLIIASITGKKKTDANKNIAIFANFWKLTCFNDDTNRRCSKFTSGQGTNDKISDKREMAKDYEKRFTRQCH